MSKQNELPKRSYAGFAPPALRYHIRLRLALDAKFLKSTSVQEPHINAVLAGTEEPNEALLAALCLARQPDGTFTLITD